MALSVKVGQFAQPTSTNASFAVTGVGFQPKAIIFFGNHQTADGSGVDAFIAYGMATGTAARAAISTVQNNSSTTASRSHIATRCIYYRNSGGSTLTQADLVSFDSDGFTLNFSTVDANARKINYIALGGSDLTNATVLQFQSGSGATQAVTGVGFQPDSVLFMSATTSTAPGNTDTGSVDAMWGFGKSSTARASTAVNGPSNSEVVQKTNKVITRSSGGGALTFEADLTSLDSDGFTLNWSTISANRYIWALCLKGGQFNVGSFNQPTSTGNAAVTGVGFTPTGIILASGNKATSSSVNTPKYQSFGAASSTSSRAAIWMGGVDSGNNDNALDTASAITMRTEGVSGATTVKAAADLVSFDSDGFTLNWTSADATAREVLYMAFGSTAAVSGRLFRTPILNGLGGVGQKLFNPPLTGI